MAGSSKDDIRIRIHKRIRQRVSGTPERQRLAGAVDEVVDDAVQPVRVGQDIPLYDERTLRLLPAPQAH